MLAPTRRKSLMNLMSSDLGDPVAGFLDTTPQSPVDGTGPTQADRGANELLEESSNRVCLKRRRSDASEDIVAKAQHPRIKR
jgi:hypothetical protein